MKYPGEAAMTESGEARPEVAAISHKTPLWATLTATVFGIGRLRPGPGTWGSLVTVLLWAALAHSLAPGRRAPVAIALALAITLIGIAAATRVARGSGLKRSAVRGD